MSAFYELVGRLVVAFVRRRYGADMRSAALGLGAFGLLLIIAVYLATGERRR